MQKKRAMIDSAGPMTRLARVFVDSRLTPLLVVAMLLIPANL